MAQVVDYLQRSNPGFSAQSAGDGIYFNSVRHAGGKCFALYYPDLISDVIQTSHYNYRWDGKRISDVLEITHVQRRLLCGSPELATLNAADANRSCTHRSLLRFRSLRDKTLRFYRALVSWWVSGGRSQRPRLSTKWRYDRDGHETPVVD